MVAARFSSAKSQEAATEFIYQQSSSSLGKASVRDGSSHFAGTDSALTANETNAMPNAWLVPSLAGAIAIGFNLPHMEPKFVLRIPREVLADIFLGRIRQWSALAPWNPPLAGVDRNITLIVRSESSGTTDAFTGALSSFSPAWKAQVGRSSLPKWPQPEGMNVIKAEGNAGVAFGIRLYAYSIGYTARVECDTYDVFTANISNKAGEFIAPSLQAVQSAMDAFETELRGVVDSGSKSFFLSIADPRNTSTESYPIAMLTYIVFDPVRLDCKLLRDVLFLLYWMWTDGSDTSSSSTSSSAWAIASSLKFSTLSVSIHSLLTKALRSIRCDYQKTVGPMDEVLLQVLSPCRLGTVHSQEDPNECIGCAPGYFSNDGRSLQCDPCQPGLYQSEWNGTSCIKCDNFVDQGKTNGNSYQEKTQATICVSCPVGTQRSPGSYCVSPEDCTCIQNYWRHDELKGRTCFKCPSGAVCAGGINLPAPEQNFWGIYEVFNPSQPVGATNLTAYANMTETTRLGRRLRVLDSPGMENIPGDPPYLLQCANSNCLANFMCKAGYTGTMCAECERGQFLYAGSCGTPCKDLQSPEIVNIVAILAVLMAWIGINVFMSSDALDVLLLYMQIMAIVFSFTTQYAGQSDAWKTLVQLFVLAIFEWFVMVCNAVHSL